MRLRLILGDTAVRRPRTRRSAKIKMPSAVRPYNIICRISFLCHSLTGDIVWMSITTPHETYPFETLPRYHHLLTTRGALHGLGRTTLIAITGEARSAEEMQRT